MGDRRGDAVTLDDDPWAGMPEFTGETSADPITTAVERLEAALLDTNGLDTIPDPVPLVEPTFLFVDTLAWMVGKAGHGKSFLAIDIAASVGTGTSWHGRAVRHGPVLYLIAEGVRGIKQRVRAWERLHGVKATGVDFLPMPVQASNASAWAALVELARRRGYVLIVLDTQARITVGLEENSNREMGTFVQRAEELRASAAACVLIIHHIGRNGETGRGATTLDGALSTIIKVTKDGARLTLENQKNKDAEEWPSMHLTLTPSGKSAVVTTEPVIPASLVRGPTTQARETAARWAEMHGNDWVSNSALMKSLAMTEATYYRHTRELRNQGWAEVEDVGRTKRLRLVGDPTLTDQTQSLSPLSPPKGW